MKKIYLGVLSCLMFLTTWAQTGNGITKFSIIPQPQRIEYSAGSVKIPSQVVVSYNKKLKSEATLLADMLKSEFGAEVKLKKGSKGNIVLKLNPKFQSSNTEAYCMSAGNDAVTIEALDANGVFNGIQTLRQIIRKDNNGLSVQKSVINDQPAFSWRAFMLDEARNFHGKKVVLDLLDRMAELKMNVFHWHLCDDQGWRVEIKKYPKLTEVGSYRDSTEINHFGSNVFDGKPQQGFYTQEDIKEIVAYAGQRHITVVPEVEMPGHASAAIASYPWLGTTGKQIKVPCKFGVQYNVYNVADPKVLQFLEDVVDEFITMFPSQVFHIGGDEVRYDPWNGSEQIQAYMKEKGIKSPAGLQVYFTNNISNMLEKKGKRMMGWNEITGAQVNEYQKGAAADHQLSKTAVVQFWKGELYLIKDAIKNGYDIVNSYNGTTYLDYNYNAIPLKTAYNFNPIPAGLTSAEQKKVLGMGCQMWGEFIPTLERLNYQVFPRIAAYAEAGWCSADNKDYARFREALKFFLNRWADKGIKYGPLD